MLTAVGCHVFAGGFTRGVQDAGWHVPVQLEVHNFGLDTARDVWGVQTINDENAHWPLTDGQMLFGNPRCTAFSTITSGEKYTNEKSNAHGPWAKQTCDIHQLCEYGAGRFDFVIWESVQQAFTTGRPMINYLIEKHFAPKNYRVAHVFINAATFGNAQQRKRYFFVAYRDCYKFNAEPPPLSPYYATLYDVISSGDGKPLEYDEQGDEVYDANSYYPLNEDERYVVPNLPSGWSLNTLGRYGRHLMPDRYKFKAEYASSGLPFSLHCIIRLNWLRPSPTLSSSARKFIHPGLDRPLTIGELATIMGWPEGCVPRGPKPVAQIAKGIVPAVGKWLARQVELSIAGHWGQDDWESSYCDKDGEWKGGDSSDKLEKIIDMTRYVGKDMNEAKYDGLDLLRYQFNVDGTTGRVVVPWQELARQNSRLGWTPADVRILQLD